MVYLTLKQLRFLNRRVVSLSIQSIKVTNNESVLTKTTDLLCHKEHECIGCCATLAGPITKFNPIKIRMWSLYINKSRRTTSQNIWALNIEKNLWPSTKWRWMLENQNKLWTERTNRKCGYSKIYKKQKNSLAGSRDADGW